MQARGLVEHGRKRQVANLSLPVAVRCAKVYIYTCQVLHNGLLTFQPSLQPTEPPDYIQKSETCKLTCLIEDDKGFGAKVCETTIQTRVIPLPASFPHHFWANRWPRPRRPPSKLNSGNSTRSTLRYHREDGKEDKKQN